MGWSDLKINDLAAIPDRYLVSWKFLNAFFKAYQERADFIEGANRAETYDDILLTGAQVSRASLVQRLSIFHANVLSCFSGTTWYKSSTWSDLSSFSSGKAISTGLGLGIVNFDEWDEQALKTLLTEDVYDLIFTSFNFSVAFDPAYWSGLYKLLTVLKYRQLRIVASHDPQPTEPYLVINGSREGTGTAGDSGESAQNANSVLSAAVGTALGNATSSNNGSRLLMWSRVDSESLVITTTPFHDPWDEEFYRQNNGSARFKEVTGKPFCVVPAAMDIQFLVDRGNSYRQWIGNTSMIKRPPEEEEDPYYTASGSASKIGPITATAAYDYTNDDTYYPTPWEIETTYSPDQSTFNATAAENPKFGVNYAGDRCEVSLGSLPNFLESYSLGDAQAPNPPVAEVFGGPNETNKSVGVSNYYYINMAMCKLPQGEFDYPV